MDLSEYQLQIKLLSLAESGVTVFFIIQVQVSHRLQLLCICRLRHAKGIKLPGGQRSNSGWKLSSHSKFTGKAGDSQLDASATPSQAGSGTNLHSHWQSPSTTDSPSHNLNDPVSDKSALGSSESSSNSTPLLPSQLEVGNESHLDSESELPKPLQQPDEASARSNFRSELTSLKDALRAVYKLHNDQLFNLLGRYALVRVVYFQTCILRVSLSSMFQFPHWCIMILLTGGFDL